jgi:hypothetical protein
MQATALQMLENIYNTYFQIEKLTWSTFISKKKIQLHLLSISHFPIKH